MSKRVVELLKNYENLKDFDFSKDEKEEYNQLVRDTSINVVGKGGLEDIPELKQIPAITPDAMAEVIKNYVYVGLSSKKLPTPLLIFGRPGIGKSTIVGELEKYDIDVVDIRLAYFDVSDLITTYIKKSDLDNKPKEVRYHILEKAYAKWLIDLCKESSKPAVVLLLDELDKANPIIYNVLLQLALDRKYDELELPRNVFIVAVANYTIDSPTASSIFSNKALFDRFDEYAMLPSLKSWIKYAHANGVASEVITYLKLNPDKLYYYDEETELILTTPRRWEKISNLMNLFNQSYEKKYKGIEKIIEAFLKYVGVEHVAGLKEVLFKYWYSGDVTNIPPTVKEFMEKIGAKSIEELISHLNTISQEKGKKEGRKTTIVLDIEKGEGVKKHDIVLKYRILSKLRVQIGREFGLFLETFYNMTKKFNEYVTDISKFYNDDLRKYLEQKSGKELDKETYEKFVIQKITELAKSKFSGLNQKDLMILTYVIRNKVLKSDIDVELAAGGMVVKRISLSSGMLNIIRGLVGIVNAGILKMNMISPITIALLYNIKQRIKEKGVVLNEDALIDAIKSLAKGNVEIEDEEEDIIKSIIKKNIQEKTKEELSEYDLKMIKIILGVLDIRNSLREVIDNLLYLDRDEIQKMMGVDSKKRGKKRK